MNRRKKLTGLGGVFLAVLLVLAAGTSSALEINMTAGQTTKTLADGTTITVWGYAVNPPDGDGVIKAPGDPIIVPPGEGLTVNLTNNLPEPTSLHILGQILSDNSPVYAGGRVNSFTHETLPANPEPVSYTWAALSPGTYFLQSGTNPAKQVGMGLAAPVIVDAAANVPYPGVDPYDVQVILVFSDFDPDVNAAVAGGYYGASPVAPPPPGEEAIPSSIYRVPEYFLINGMVYPDEGLDPVNDGTLIAPGDRVLLRFLNVGLETRAPQFLETYMTLIAEDGVPYTYELEQNGIELLSAKTFDAIIDPAPATALRLYDARLGLTNAGDADPGGMLTYVKVTVDPQGTLNVSPEPVFGTVRSGSLPGGINCPDPDNPDACTEQHNPDTQVRLSAESMPTTFFAGSLFQGWTGGGCEAAGPDDCVVTVPGGGAVTVQAIFQKLAAIGVFRNGTWYFETNGDGAWDAGTDVVLASGSFGLAADIPITGDWDGDGATDIGVFRNGAWYFDVSGNGIWDGPITDRAIAAGGFGRAADTPLTGDWNGDGVTEIGVFRNGAWYLDANGNGSWDGPATDTLIAAGGFGLAADTPLTGDWNGDGVTEIGVFRSGAWFLDVDGNGAWNPAADTNIPVGGFGLATDIPVTGHWNNDLITDIGVFRNGIWYLDGNGNGQWNAAADLVIPFGTGGDVPITGR